MTRDGEKTNSTGVRGASEPFDDASSRDAEPPGRDLLDLHQFAVVGPTSIAFRHSVLVAIAAVGRYYRPPFATAVKDAHDPLTRRTEHAIGPSIELMSLALQVTQRPAAAPVGRRRCPRTSLGHLTRLRTRSRTRLPRAGFFCCAGGGAGSGIGRLFSPWRLCRCRGRLRGLASPGLALLALRGEQRHCLLK